jgi:hypothetical protein
MTTKMAHFKGGLLDAWSRKGDHYGVVPYLEQPVFEDGVFARHIYKLTGTTETDAYYTFERLELGEHKPTRSTFDHIRLNELMPRLKALLDEYGAVIDPGPYADGPAEVRVGLATIEAP